ncbi:zf-CCHC domain-containing protein, partial [Tanacetum coccineum]
GFYNCGEEGHFIGECPKPKENKAFVGGAWSDSEDGNKPQNDTTCLIAIDSQEVLSKPSSSNNDLDIIDLQKENEEILKGGHSNVDPSCDVLNLGALYSWEFLLKFHLYACDFGS